MIARLTAIATLFIAIPAMAQETPVPTATPTPPAVPEPKICRTVTETGSRMGKRVCLTKAQWSEINNGGGMNRGFNPGRLSKR